MLNQICEIEIEVNGSTRNGSVLRVIPKKKARSYEIDVYIAVLWDDGTMSSENAAEIAEISSYKMLKHRCALSRDSRTGYVLDFIEGRVLKENDSPVDAVVLWDDNTITIEDISSCGGSSSGNEPGVPVVGSGSGITSIWESISEFIFHRLSGGFVSVMFDGSDHKDVKVIIEKEIGDNLYLIDISKYDLFDIEMTNDSRYLKIILKHKGKKSHVLLMKNMVDGVSVTLYRLMNNGGLKVDRDYGLFLDSALSDPLVPDEDLE